MSGFFEICCYKTICNKYNMLVKVHSPNKHAPKETFCLEWFKPSMSVFAFWPVLFWKYVNVQFKYVIFWKYVFSPASKASREVANINISNV